MGGGNVKRQERAEIVPETIYTHMSELLGAPIASEVDAWHFVKQGISTKRYVILAERLQLAPDAVASISILRRRVKMLERRAKSPQVKRQRKKAAVQAEEARLTPTETERLMRCASLVLFPRPHSCLVTKKLHCLGSSRLAISFLAKTR